MVILRIRNVWQIIQNQKSLPSDIESITSCVSIRFLRSSDKLYIISSTAEFIAKNFSKKEITKFEM
jgi:hypothetical protein